MAKKIGLITLALVVAIAVVFTGCTPARRPMDNNGTGSNTNYGNVDNGNMGTGGNQGFNESGYGINGTGGGRRYGNTGSAGNAGYTGFDGNQGDMYNGGQYYNTRTGLTNNTTNNATTQQADNLARTCEQVNGVERATVVVTGNTAYVGVNLDENNRMANERDIKKEVAQKIRASGQDINTVYVSTEANFMDRLRGVGEGVRSGRPVEGFRTELDEMIQRITPARW